jgi:hypothetical protein
MDESGQRIALHNLTQDRAEQTDASATHSDIVARMKPKLIDWIKTLPASADPSCLHQGSAK